MGGPPAGRGAAELRMRGQLGFVRPLARVPRAEKPRSRRSPPASWRQLTPASPPPRTKLKREILSGVHLGLGPRAGGVLPQGGSPGPQVALPIQTNMQCHYGGSCCSRPRGCSGTAGAPHPYMARKAKEGPRGWGSPGGCLEETPRPALPHLPAAFRDREHGTRAASRLSLPGLRKQQPRQICSY